MVAEQNRLDFDTFLTDEEVDELFGLRDEEYRNVYILKRDGSHAILRNFDDNVFYPSEPEITASLKRLVLGPTTVGYAVGSGARYAMRTEGEDHFFALLDRPARWNLINHGFAMTELSLNDIVPDDIDILVLAAPTEPMSESELGNLRAYVASGRNLLIMMEPGVSNVAASDLGVEIGDQPIFEGRERLPKDMVLAFAGSGSAKSGFFRTSESSHRPVLLSGAAPLRAEPNDGFGVIPLLRIEDSEDNADGALAIALERSVNGGTQRVVVIGDADFMSASVLNYPTPAELVVNNRSFVQDVFGYLANGEYPIDTRKPDPIDTKFAIELKDVRYFKVALYGVLPAIIALLGSTLLLRRRRA